MKHGFVSCFNKKFPLPGIFKTCSPENFQKIELAVTEETDMINKIILLIFFPLKNLKIINTIPHYKHKYAYTTRLNKPEY